MKYDIVATLGPSSHSPALWQDLLNAGATAFRLNTSHLSLTQLRHWLDQLTPFLSARRHVPPLILDLQGSKWRLGEFTTRTLQPGQHLNLVYAATADRPETLPVPHRDFFQAAALSSAEISLNDARITLVREMIGPELIRTRVVTGGEISSRKGITYAASTYRQEEMTEKDRAILEMTRGLPFARYAISYLRDARELHRYHDQFGHAYLIAKLERPAALEEALLIAAVANEIWLCRGDLGAELGLQAMAEAVLRFSLMVGQIAVPTLLAGQVLEHMTEHPVPTRSEICYLYEALQKGYRGCVLSDEIAIGRYPVESCRLAALFRDPLPEPA